MLHNPLQRLKHFFSKDWRFRIAEAPPAGQNQHHSPFLNGQKWFPSSSKGFRVMTSICVYECLKLSLQKYKRVIFLIENFTPGRSPQYHSPTRRWSEPGFYNYLKASSLVGETYTFRYGKSIRKRKLIPIKCANWKIFERSSTLCHSYSIQSR